MDEREDAKRLEAEGLAAEMQMRSQRRHVLDMQICMAHNRSVIAKDENDHETAFEEGHLVADLMRLLFKLERQG